LSGEPEARSARAPVPEVGDPPGTILLPTVLSLIAGSTDAIGFMGLGGLFTAHVTGNLVVLAAHVVAGEKASVATMLSVPVFILVLGLTRLLAGALERVRVASLRPVLLVQFLLLCGFLALCVKAGPRVDPDTAIAIVAAMLGVSAMALQNALVQISLKGSPTTAVITTNITHLMMDLGQMVLSHDPIAMARARKRAKHTWPAIAGFAIGCGLGATCEATAGLWSLALPAGLALVALVMGH